MQIAKVYGTVVSTYKEPNLSGSKFLLLQIVDLQGDLTSEYEVATDTVGAGVDEWVLFTRGSGARQVHGLKIVRLMRRWSLSSTQLA